MAEPWDADPRGGAVDDESLLSFLYQCPVGLLQTTAAGDVQMINPEAARLLLPVTRTPVLQNLFAALEASAPELRGMVERWSGANGVICAQHRIFVSRSGAGPQVLACSLSRIGPDCLMAVLQDVTMQVEQERKLRQNEAMFAALVAGVRDFALFTLDRNGLIDSWNLSCERQTGFTAAEVTGRDLGMLCLATAGQEDEVAEQVAEAVQEGWSLRNRWCIRRDGGRTWCQIMVAANGAFDGGDGAAPPGGMAAGGGGARSPIAGFAVVLRDVSEQRVTGEELQRLLTTDFLTGAVNRGHFFTLAEIEIARHRQQGLPLAALMLDLDHFKSINDCFGHAAGDLVLQRLVAVCRGHLRERDVLGRMGGEEFAVLLPGTDLAGAVGIAEGICRAVARDITLPGDGCLDGSAPARLRVGISIGCAMLDAATPGIDALLSAADAALYDAKRAGRGQVWPGLGRSAVGPGR